MNNVMDLIEEYGDFMFKAGYDNVQHDISTEAESYRRRILAALATTPSAEAVDAAQCALPELPMFFAGHPIFESAGRMQNATSLEAVRAWRDLEKAVHAEMQAYARAAMSSPAPAGDLKGEGR